MVLVVVDHANGQPDDLSLQALTLGRGLAAAVGEPLEALVVGEAGRPVAAGLGAYGVATVHLAVHPGLTGYAPLATARAAQQVMATSGATVVLAAGSPRGNEVMAHLGAVTDLPVAADCLAIRPGDPSSVTRARWGGSLLEEAVVHAPTTLATVAAHAVTAEPGGATTSAVAELTPELSDADLLVQAGVAAEQEASGAVSLADAKVVISGGRGVGSAEGFAPLEELAGLLGGAVGCSRVVTGNGWRPHTEQVGQTGIKIAPDLYVACGISGATQHIAGCRNAKTMIVINDDPEAPIMGYADYAVVGDLKKILPAVIDEVRRAQAEGST
jgi:electron transfer flavoprotein alpha subunit